MNFAMQLAAGMRFLASKVTCSGNIYRSSSSRFVSSVLSTWILPLVTASSLRTALSRLLISVWYVVYRDEDLSV